MNLQPDGVCKRCHRKDDKRRADEPCFFSSGNHLDFGDMPGCLSPLEPIEEMLIACVHVSVSVYSVRGQQFRYRGHVVYFLRNVGKIYEELPLLPQDLDIVILRPSSDGPEIPQQFRKRFRVCRRVLEQWLRFLSVNHPGYAGFTLNMACLDQLPENGDILDKLST